jgi:hypothetical protein
MIARTLGRVPAIPAFFFALWLPWMRFWDPSVHQSQWDGVATLAWLGVLLGGAAAVDRRDLAIPRPRLGAGWALALCIVVGAAVAMFALRRASGVVANELFLFPPRSMSGSQIYLWDMGLPSLFHNVWIAPARLWGGVAWVLALHVALHAVSLVAMVRALSRRVEGWVAWLAASLVSTLDLWLFQFAELRAYATYLTAMGIAAWAMVPGRRVGARRLGLAVLAMGLAALDSPSVAIPLAAFALGVLWEEGGADLWGALFGGLRAGDAPTRWLRGVGLALLGLVPVSLASRDLHHLEKTRLVFLSNPVIASEVGVVLVAAAWLAWRRPDARPLALTTLAAVGTPVAMVLTRMLRDDPKYQLLALPFAVVVVLWSADEACGRMGRGWRAAMAALVVLGVAAVHRPFTPSVGFPWDPDLERHARTWFSAGLGAAVVVTFGLLVWRGRALGAAVVAPLLVVLGVSAAAWQGVRAYALVVDLEHGATECDADLDRGPAAWSQVRWGNGDRALRCQARAIERARLGWTEPLYRNVDVSAIKPDSR